MSYAATWEQAFVKWVRLCLAPFDAPTPTPPAVTPAAHTVVVIIADQEGAPRPLPPYAAIRVLNERSLGSLMRSGVWDGAQLTTTTYDRREGTVSISIFGPRAQDMADALCLGVEDEELTAPLNAASIALGAELSRVTVGAASASVVDKRVVIDYRYRRTAETARATNDIILHASLNFAPVLALGAEPDPDIEILIPPFI